MITQTDYGLTIHSVSLPKNSLQYPKPILDIEYDPQGVIRGLHYDIPKGLLMKLDSINQVRNLAAL